MGIDTLTAEKASTKLAAFFDSERQLDDVSQALRREAELQNPQLWMVRPHDSDYAHKLEPETQGVARTAIRSHLILGLLGLGLGLILWGIMYAMGLPAIRSSPIYSGAAIVAFSTVAGLLLGGLVTARPDHQIVIQAVGKATSEGRWSLVMHPRNEAQCKAAEAVLEAAGVERVRSI